MIFDHEENLWLALGDNGLEKMTFGKNTVDTKHFTHDKTKPNSLISNTCLTILKDRTNMLWIGTMEGISLLNR
jgi:ligand-binding sensor domain-containing protein